MKRDEAVWLLAVVIVVAVTLGIALGWGIKPCP